MDTNLKTIRQILIEYPELSDFRLRQAITGKRPKLKSKRFTPKRGKIYLKESDVRKFLGLKRNPHMEKSNGGPQTKHNINKKPKIKLK